MEHFDTRKYSGAFDVLTNTRSAQAAMMTLRPGESSGDKFTNEHPRSEQWVFVVDGSAEALVGKTKSTRKKIVLKKGELLVINKGELHQLKNTGRKPLRLLNWYAPPAYTKKGDLKATAREHVRN
jgi:mannose-6-phosphate isomerase-like protein (cupin superfamily)